MSKMRIVVLLALLLVFALGGIAGATVDWGKYLGYPIAKVKVDGTIKNPATPAIIIQGHTYVPLRYIGEILSANVDWDQYNRTVLISTTPTTTQPTTPKQWVTVATLSGSTEKRGTPFNLTGAQARLTYTVNGDMPFCAIYVMKDGTTLENDGGFPEVTVTDNKGDSTMLVKDAGTYYIDVNAVNCSWTVTIEEYK